MHDTVKQTVSGVTNPRCSLMCPQSPVVLAVLVDGYSALAVHKYHILRVEKSGRLSVWVLLLLLCFES